MTLTSVLSDATGVTGRAILGALIAGQRDPRQLADLAVGEARNKIPELVEALDGEFTDHHAFMCRHYLDQLDLLAAVINHLTQRIEHLIAGHDQDLDNLATIPGIARTAAQIIIAETGGDMAPFATAGHLASWIGVCPGMNESAGVNKSGRTRPGNSNAKRLLGIAAMAALRDKTSYLRVYYRRVATRRGRQRALVAVMHKRTIAIWHVLHDHVPYRDLGADHFTKRNPERAIRRMIKETNSLGLTIRFDPITAARPLTSPYFRVRLGPMTRYIALLRGINVGGRSKVAMAALRDTCESIGCTDVTTYIQSGNVLLTSPLSPTKLRGALEAAIAEQLGVSPVVVIRTPRQLAEVIASNPFPTADTDHLHVAFLSEQPDAQQVIGLAELDHPPEQVAVRGAEAYFHLPNGMGRAKIPELFGRRVKAPATVRNWRTVNKLLRMSSS